ncbi:MAG TPA: NB-ARC domain-containing protein, partial [Verrucomicrobiae bacterium]
MAPKNVAPVSAADPGAYSVKDAQAGRDIIAAKEVHIHNAPAAPLSPLHQLPSAPELVGREEELAALLQQLTAAGASGATISAQHAGLQGMGGVGKTALAIVLAHRLRDRFPDAQLFLNLHAADSATPEVTPLDAMQRIIHCFHPDARLPDSVEEVAAIYCSVLTDAGRVLLVLDNAAAAQVQPLLPPPNCLLLVTSRAQFKLPGLVQRNLDCLEPAKSVELLCKLSSRWQGDEAKDAAGLCGHLPLALEVFAGAVNDQSLTPVPELLARLRARVDTLAPVDAAFEVSYGLLAEELRAAWTALAVFPASFDLRAAAAVWGTGGPAAYGVRGQAQRDPALASVAAVPSAGKAPSPLRSAGALHDDLEAARATMQALVNASLVEWNAAAGRFRLHDLVRAFCDGKLSAAARDELHFAHARHYTVIAEEADKIYLDGNPVAGLALFDRERAQIEAAFAWLDDDSRRRESADFVASPTEDQRRL